MVDKESLSTEGVGKSGADAPRTDVGRHDSVDGGRRDTAGERKFLINCPGNSGPKGTVLVTCKVGTGSGSRSELEAAGACLLTVNEPLDLVPPRWYGECAVDDGCHYSDPCLFDVCVYTDDMTECTTVEP